PPSWSPERASWGRLHRRLPAAGALSPAVVHDDPEAQQGIAQHQRVCHHEHPVVDQYAVDGEARRGHHLTDEEPARHAVALSLLPLLVDLVTNREHQDRGAHPADRFDHSICRFWPLGVRRKRPPSLKRARASLLSRWGTDDLGTPWRR